GNSQRFHIITQGCQMNVRDSQAMAGLLAGMGYQPTEDPGEADIILLNTCTVREGADDRAYGRLGELHALKRRRPGLILGIAGCLVQKDRERVRERAPYLDLVFGVHNIHRLPELLRQVRDGCLPVYEVWDRSDRDRPLPVPPALRGDPIRGFVNIIHGCNKFCTFCIVPYVRGRERSAPPEAVAAEVEGLAAQGYCEVTLLGQNVDSYGHDLTPRRDLADLLRLVHDVDGIERIRFTTSHPRDMTLKLIRTVAELPKVCEHIHLPVQAGDDRLLRRMHRAYTTAQYRATIDAIRAAMPQASVTTDVIVGFPGETDEEFEGTVRLVNEVQFDAVNTAIYSPREGTPAAGYPDQVPEATKRRRLHALNALVERIAAEVNRALVGTRQEVLVEGPGTRGGMVGRTRTNKVVILDGDAGWIGRTVPVEIASAGSWVLRGRAGSQVLR
ncbi:MAG TPA: tRNA (N6-isopentenyl adenosine(37)-C2)-methylthiotransferase MiaB, partial [bacterium]|nr:tRNA (N6-isopentenyl adenosine(37)-C2)-methylthiotransferase MiaB [bacterium]